MKQTADLVRERITGEIVTFGEQTKRRTGDKTNNINEIHVLDVWGVDNEICLGHIKLDDKSNEITAMPMLMEILDLAGTMITADALNTQKAIALIVDSPGLKVCGEGEWKVKVHRAG